MTPQYTTPTFLLTFTEQSLDLTEAENVYVSFRSQGYTLTKTGESLVIQAKSIQVKLSQEETGHFIPGVIEIQVNWTMASGDRAASDIVKCQIDRQLLTEVVD